MEATKNTQKQNTETGTLKKTHGNAEHWFQHPHQHGPERAAFQTEDDGWQKASRERIRHGRFCA